MRAKEKLMGVNDLQRESMELQLNGLGMVMSSLTLLSRVNECFFHL